jgi:hypothetical protein
MSTKINKFFEKLIRFAGSPLARRLILALFVLQAGFLVFTVNFGTPPDENSHIRFIEYYAEHSVDPVFTDQQSISSLGDKTREVDYLYHYIMSLAYRVLPMAPEAKYFVIRLASLAMALLCLVLTARLFKRIGVSNGAVNVALLLLTNLPMVLMLSTAINSDVLVWLGMILGVMLLVRLWTRPTAADLLWLACLVVLGGLVKRNLLVLGVLFSILGFIVLVRHFRAFIDQLKKPNWQIIAATIVLVVGLGLFAERVGGNLVRYHSVAVTCDQVHGEEACYNFWANARARELERRPPTPLMPTHEFVIRWIGESFFNIVDIQTQFWRHEVKPAQWLTTVLVYALAIGLALGGWYERQRWRKDAASRFRLFAVFIGLFYIVAQLLVNYSTYRHFHAFGVALNGRYIIPSVLLLAPLACFYWASLLKRRPKLLVIFAVGLLLFTILGSGLIMMLRNPQLFHG